MQRDIESARQFTSAPINLNLFALPPTPPIAAPDQQAALAAVSAYYTELGLPPPVPAKAPYSPDLEAQLNVIEDTRPQVCTLHFGAVDPARMRRMQAAGIRIGVSATCVAEAQHLQSLGVDFIIAQGAEAGGHRGSYLRDAHETMTGTLALTRLVVRAVTIPVVAAGGIMDGAAIAAVLALGAQGAQLGTAFLTCSESGAPPVHKQSLLAAREDTTRVTEKFSGRAARGLTNRFMREMESRDTAQLAFPAQNMITGPLRAASAKVGSADFLAMWAGQAAPLARELSAAQLVAALEQETVEAIERLSALRG
jgi:nitronate monooxygenase